MKFLFQAMIGAFRGRGIVQQHIPDVTKKDVEQVVRRDFPSDQFDSVMAVLISAESPRVQLAALKLAHSDLKLLQRQIAAAERDYRDVLAAAEYPLFMKADALGIRKLSRKELQRVIASDWDQYQRWLRSKLDHD